MLKFKKIITGFLIVSILVEVILGFLYWKNKDLVLQQIETPSVSAQNRVYELTPQNFIGQTVVDSYPHVSISPFSLQYFLVPIKEDKQLKNGSYDSIFFASKRIAEMHAWGQQMEVKGNVKNFSEITVWWNQVKPKSLWDFSKRKLYTSWEASLARYAELIQNQINQINQNYKNQTDGLKLQQTLSTHQETIIETIKNDNISQSHKDYLTPLVQQMFSSFAKDLHTSIENYDPSIAVYYLSDVLSQKDEGIYKATIDIANIPQAVQGDILLSQDNEESSQQSELFPQSVNQYFKEYQNITVDRNKQSLTLHLPESQSTPETQWIEISQKTKPNKFSYIYRTQFHLSSNKKTQPYLFLMNTGDLHPSQLSIQKIYLPTAQKKYRKKSYLVDTKIFEPNDSPLYKTAFYVDDTEDAAIQIDLGAKEKIPLEHLNSISLRFIQIYSPPITIEKTATLPDQHEKIEYKKTDSQHYSVTITNLSLPVENQLIASLSNNWDITNRTDTENTTNLTLENRKIKTITKYLILNFIVWIAVFFSYLLWRIGTTRMICIYLLKKIRRIIQLLSGNLLKSIRFVAPYLTLVCFVLLFFDVFLLKSFNDILYAFLILIWIVLSISFHAEARIHFAVAFFLLILIPFVYLFRNDLLTEKIAIWAYLFMLIGTLAGISELNKNRQLRTYESIVVELKQITLLHILFGLVGFVWLILKRLRKLIFLLVQSTFIWPPKTIKDWLRNILVSAIYVLCISFAIYISLTLHNMYLSYRHEQDRKTLNPVIASIEPTIAYRGTKIAIYGKGFDWREYTKVKLQSSQGEIQTDIWNGDKIIFTVPLSWKVGETNIWVEKYLTWDGKPTTAKSEMKKIKIIPVSSTFTPDDDEYFRQMKKASKEIQELNGYEENMP